jgi:hypothetical protein
MAEIRESNGSVVILGKMNPLIFQPQWLRDHGIIGQAEADAAVDGNEIDIMHPQITSLNLNSMTLTVEPNRFVVSAAQEPVVLARDFAVNCFSLLRHTPTSALGLNFSVTFRLSKESAWHSFGDLLAPKDPWHALLNPTGRESQRVGGIRTLTMERSRRLDDYLGYERVTVEGLEGGGHDTKLTFNDHYQFDPKSPKPAADLVEILGNRWEESAKRSKTIFDSLIEQADAL